MIKLIEQVESQIDPSYCSGVNRLLVDLCTEGRKLIQQKDEAYAERNRLVALLTLLFPASLERHPENEVWEDDWRWIVFIDLPTGQVSWHIHDSELPLFEHISRNQGRVWDGHTTEEKYLRIEQMKDRYSTSLA